MSTQGRTAGGIDTIAGLILIAIAVLGFIISFDYDAGSVQAMGPGFFPRALSVLLGACGAGLLALGLIRGAPRLELPRGIYRATLIILAAIALYSFGVERFGLVTCTAAAVFISTFADRDWRLVRSIVLSASVAALVYVIFILGLAMPVTAFGIWS